MTGQKQRGHKTFLAEHSESYGPAGAFGYQPVALELNINKYDQVLQTHRKTPPYRKQIQQIHSICYWRNFSCGNWDFNCTFH